MLAQDQHVAGYALEAGKGLVIVVNKIDLVEPAKRKPAYWRKALAKEFKFAPFAPVVAVSAKTREGIGAIMPAALEVVGQRRIKMPPNELNRVLREAFDEHPPPSYKGQRLKARLRDPGGLRRRRRSCCSSTTSGCCTSRTGATWRRRSGTGSG